MDEKQELLLKWVKQPPARPLIQYLRDAEKVAAWKLMGRSEKAMDLASECNVTKGIDAKHVTRVDVSKQASDYASEILRDHVKDFIVIDAENPQFVVGDQQYNAAVSIGPYDWLFLDIHKLTREMYRIIDDDGVLVFSVPTFRSPYATASKGKLKYYSKEDLFALIEATNWKIVDYKLVYQLKYKLHRFVNRKCPVFVQRLFVNYCWRMTDVITNTKKWEDASYIVVKLKKNGNCIRSVRNE
ncbi:class I SAM-dependent methyltransferase [Radiobacillus sp. PE A8.2]|uniref:class I SAM-dependent methyltransferase n=1 Tax=Radiobacillus sp. PE A8.2 TaxID=3380349 RepID=UPI0038910B22